MAFVTQGKSGFCHTRAAEEVGGRGWTFEPQGGKNGGPWGGTKPVVEGEVSACLWHVAASAHELFRFVRP